MDANNKNTLLSEFALDVLNCIYITVQQNLFAVHPKEYQERIKIEINIQTLQGLLLRKRKDIDDVKNAIEELYQTDVVLKDFVHPVSGSKYREFHTRIIESYGYRKEDKNTCDMQMNEIFLVNIMRHPKDGARNIGNFTPIRMNIAAALKGKYTKRLYEYIESVITIKSEFSLNMDSLNKLFGTDHKHFSRIVEMVKRSEKQMQGLFNFKYLVFKEDKLISFSVARKTKLEDFQ
ncbi:RepB family plasmid replication initiator protein [Sulfurimonas sp.]|uniref:RepB family plasmid replication initiator protein n=1 Tax=Sulfurimonas sp. TaxID=2022749 RepID=UPI0025DA746B|nr:RepB family plasmid replication initiator protein [Sulfurimonas sp.]MBW6487574.1 replication initiation protein [Sulfurimonas sp.]